MYCKDENFLPLCPYSSDLNVYQRNKVIIATQVVKKSCQYATFLRKKAKLQVST